MAKVNYTADDFLDKDSFITTLNEITTAIKSLDSNMTTFAKNLDKRLQSNTETINKSKKAIEDYQASVDKITPSTKGYTDAIAKAVEEINKQANAQAKANEENKKAKKATDDLDTSLNGIKTRYKNIIEEAKKLDATTQQFKDLQAEAAKLDTEIKSLNKGFKEQAEVIQKTTVEQKGAANSIDELKKKYKELIEQANKLDSTTQEFKDLQSQAAKLDTEITTLNKGFKEQKEILDNTVKTQQAVAGSLDDLKQRYKKVIEESAKIDSNTQAFKNLQDEAQKLDRDIKKLNNGFKVQRDIAQDAAGSYDELSKKNAALKRELKSMPDVFGANAAAAKRMKEQITANDKTLKEFDSSIGESFRNVGNYASAFDGLTGGLLGAFQAGGVAGLGFAAVTKGIEFGVEKIGELIEKVAEANKQLKETESITGLTGNSLFSLTAGIDATAKKFDLDYLDVLNAANAASKEFGITQEDALSGIQNLLARGGNINGDALQVVREYSSQVSQAGLSYKQFLELQTQSVKAGLFDDKLIDTIKEGTLRLGDLTASQKDVLKTLGKSGQEVTKLFSEGKKFEAIQKLSKEIIRLQENGQNAQPIISNLFGGPGEDVGKQGFKIIAALDQTTQSLTKAEQATLDLLKAQTETGTKFNEFSARFSGVGNVFAIGFEKAKSAILDYVNELFDSFKSIGLSIEKFLSLFGSETSNKILEFFGDLLSFPFDNYAGYVDFVAQSFKKLVATIFGVSNAIRIFKIEFADSFQAIKDFASGDISFDTLKKNIKSQGEGVANAFKVGYEKTLAELNLASAAPVDSGDAGTLTNKAKNDKANESLTTTADKFKTIAQLRKELIRLTKEESAELAKGEFLRPKFLEKTRSEIEEINKLLAERKPINPNFQLNDQVANVNLDGNAKDKLVELGALSEEYRQKQLQGLITQQDLEIALFDVEKQRIEYQIANAVALNLNEEQIAKLKTEQIKLNQEIAANPVVETLRIINGQESILREQKAKGQLSDYDFELRMLEIKKKAIDLDIANADKTKKSVEEINALKATQAEIDREIATKPLNTPIANAGKEALLSYIEDAAAAAATAAFLSSLQKGENVSIAVKSAGEAFIAAKIISTFSKRKFAKGVIDLEGPGTATSDSIPSLLSRGESVITARGTDNAKNALTQINMGKLTDADIFENSKKENIQITAAKAKQDSLGMTKQELADVFANAVNKAVAEKIQVNQLSIETINGVLASVQQSQLQRQVTLFPDPTKPPTKIKNSAL